MKRNRFQLFLLASLLGAVPAAAQTVLRVGPGELYTEIQPAVDAAPPNAIILVRQGGYRGRVFIRSPVRIIAEPGTRLFDPNVRVMGLEPQDVVLLRGLMPDPGYWSLTDHIKTDGGILLLEECDFTAARVVATNAAVSMTGCQVGALSATDCDVHLSDSGGDGFLIIDYVTGVPIAYPSIAATNSRILVGGGTWRGPRDSFGYRPNTPAINLRSSSLVLTGDRTTLIEGRALASSAILMSGGSVLFLDPDPQLVATGGAEVVSGGRVNSTRIPYLQAAVEANELVTSVNTFAGRAVALLVGPPQQPVELATTIADLWTIPPAVLASGVTPGSTVLEMRTALPALPAGIAVSLQAVVATAEPELSNAATLLLPPY
ncbi:MAG: hypothetical protein AAF628_13920 [Planctomycetota bacterium]